MVCEVKCTRIDKAKMIDRNATCLDDCIATIVTYFGRDYELMFVNSWEFDFKLGDTVQEIEEIIDERAYFQYLMEGHGVLIIKRGGTAVAYGSGIRAGKTFHCRN